jgi:hypothetical protein
MRQGEQEITLANPVRQHFASFVFGNSCMWERQALAALEAHAPEAAAALVALAQTDPAPGVVPLALRDALETTGADPCVAMLNAARGQHIVICGAGPTLVDTAPAYARSGDQLWGCNSAATWLIAQGYAPTHAITVDQTPQMLEEWATAPDVEYLLASTCHPHLAEYLESRGRRFRWFHNYVGIEERPVEYDGRMMAFEDWLYAGLFPPTVRAGAGLNTVTRAIDVALFLGAAKITVLGADCALRVTKPMPEGVERFSPEHLAWLRESVVMHADGGHALRSEATATTVEGDIDGRHWLTKPDMFITAVFLAQMVRAWEGRIVLRGDTLPRALEGKDDAFLDTLPHLSNSDGSPIRYTKPHDLEQMADAGNLALTP